MASRRRLSHDLFVFCWLVRVFPLRGPCYFVHFSSIFCLATETISSDTYKPGTSNNVYHPGLHTFGLGSVQRSHCEYCRCAVLFFSDQIPLSILQVTAVFALLSALAFAFITFRSVRLLLSCGQEVAYNAPENLLFRTHIGHHIGCLLIGNAFLSVAGLIEFSWGVQSQVSPGEFVSVVMGHFVYVISKVHSVLLKVRSSLSLDILVPHSTMKLS